MSYTLGLDIGIASVGWAVVKNESGEIIEGGVRLFDSADASKNEDRRSSRAAKRTKRRKNHRLKTLRYLLEENNIIKPDFCKSTPLEARVKGLTSELKPDELYIALYNLMKYRGVSYLEDLEEAKDNPILLNDSKDLYPCQIQKNKLDEFGAFRGNLYIEGKTVINTFRIAQYEAELRKILETQSDFHNFITKDFIEEFIILYKRKREYFEGPGNETNRTNYGIYKTTGETKKNIFDELRGKCSVYNGKNGMESCLRASNASYSVQYYNLLNDLNNIKVANEKLSSQQKEEIIKYIKEQITGKNLPTIKITTVLKKLYMTESESVSGFRIKKDGKEEIHSFETYRRMKRELEGVAIDSLSIKTLDIIADILTLNTETEGMLAYFNDKESDGYEYLAKLSEHDVQSFINFRRKNKKLFARWSSFSYKLLDKLLPEMLSSGDEQNTCLTRMKIQKYPTTFQSKIDYKELIEEIYNPVVKRGIIQTTKIINSLLKKYDFSDIVIEMARENNDKDQKKRIKDSQKYNEEILEKAKKFAGLDEEEVNNRNHRNLNLKLKLYYKQQGKCLYSGNDICITKLLNNENSYEIDHIIPISISFDDSQSNKVLVETGQNRLKSNLTPYYYLMNATGTWSYVQFKAYVLELKKNSFISNKQKELLLFEENIKKEEVVQGFLNRNLNDTRYTSKEVLNNLQRFFKNNNQSTKVKVINGGLTSQFRNNTLKYDKDRSLDYRHHAVDAMICCFSIMSLKNYDKTYLNTETGEIIDNEIVDGKNKLDDQNIYMSFSGYLTREKILDFNSKIKFSHKVDRKVNRCLSDQGIYGTRTINDQEYVVNKIKDIYDDAEYEKFIKKLTDSKGEDTSDMFLMKRHDPQTWEILMKIIKMYPDVKNPFVKYRQEIGTIRKYAKKENGPEIKMLKYLDHKKGSCIRLTEHYKGAKNSVILESLNIYRSDVYFDRNNNCFNLVTIRYSDFKFDKGIYKLPLKKYEELLINEKIIDSTQKFEDIITNGHEFRFSLYKNDKIEIGDDTKVDFYSFHSKNHSSKNRFEIKGIDKKFSKQSHITAKKTTTIFNKYNVDILGNSYKVEKEELILKFRLDNKMI